MSFALEYLNITKNMIIVSINKFKYTKITTNHHLLFPRVRSIDTNTNKHL